MASKWVCDDEWVAKFFLQQVKGDVIQSRVVQCFRDGIAFAQTLVQGLKT